MPNLLLNPSVECFNDLFLELIFGSFSVPPFLLMVSWFFNITSLSLFNLFNYIKMLPCKRSRCLPHVSQNSKGEVGSCYFLLRVVWSLPVVIRLLCYPVTVARGLWRNCERKKPRAAWSSCCWHSLSSSGGMSWVGTLSDDHLEMKQLCCG